MILSHYGPSSAHPEGQSAFEWMHYPGSRGLHMPSIQTKVEEIGL